MTVATERIIASLGQLLANGPASENEVLQRLVDSITAQLATETAANSAGPDKTRLVDTALSLFAVGPLDCGYQRRTLLIAPQSQDGPALAQAFRDRSSSLANVTTLVNEAYLVREGSGLHPLHLGARLAELYPDIAEAAGRLHSRNDIHWRDLRVGSA